MIVISGISNSSEAVTPLATYLLFPVLVLQKTLEHGAQVPPYFSADPKFWQKYGEPNPLTCIVHREP